MGGCVSLAKNSTDSAHRLQPPAVQSKSVGCNSSALSEFRVIKSLGHGGEGETLLAKDVNTGQLFALKFVRRTEKLNTRHLMAEIRIQSGLLHSNIVQLHEVLLGPEYLILKLQYVPGVTLSEYIKAVRPVSHFQLMSETNARYLFTQLLSAVHYCHTENIAHRDLKLSNIIVNHTKPNGCPTLMLCDFGLSLDSPSALRLHKSCTTVGTRQYMPIEMLQNQVTHELTPYHPDKVDVWSLGVILYVLLVGRLPFSAPKGSPETKFKLMLESVKQGHYALCTETHKSMFYATRLSSDARSLLESMMHLDERQRISMQSVIAHPWTQGHLTPVHAATIDNLEHTSQHLKTNVVKLSRTCPSYSRLQQMVCSAAILPGSDTPKKSPISAYDHSAAHGPYTDYQRWVPPQELSHCVALQSSTAESSAGDPASLIKDLAMTSCSDEGEDRSAQKLDPLPFLVDTESLDNAVSVAMRRR